ncbi:MAG: hypothetical protein ACFB0B_15365 [Thermonemataceae bacterium]
MWYGQMIDQGIFTELESFLERGKRLGAPDLSQAEIDALDTLVQAKKANGTWEKAAAIYPFVGSTSAWHSLNLKNAFKFQLVFNGSPGHSASGVQFTGTQWADTGIIPANDLIGNDVSIWSYLLENDNTLGSATLGSADLSNVRSLYFIARNNDDTFRTRCSSNITNLYSPMLDARGYSGASRLAGSGQEYKVVKNGVILEIVSEAASGLNSFEAILGGFNIGGDKRNFLVNTMAFAEFAAGYTDAQIAAEYTAVQAFQTALGREV